LRSERALAITLAEMVVQGVSTRKVKAITEQLFGVEVLATQVGRAVAQLEKILQEWRERPLGLIQYLYVDTRYEKVFDSGQVHDAAVFKHRRTTRTTNSLERINKEILRRTRVFCVFPNEASCLRLVSSLLMEISEEWRIGKRYCSGKTLNC
jgi:transposase-like protein